MFYSIFIYIYVATTCSWIQSHVQIAIKLFLKLTIQKLDITCYCHIANTFTLKVNLRRSYLGHFQMSLMELCIENSQQLLPSN